MSESTYTDHGDDPWSIADEVIALRQWATLNTHPLPSAPLDELTIGRADACAIQLHDPRVSRLHARLLRSRAATWAVHDLSKNGVHLDGQRLTRAVLTPGAELELGGVRLIAESHRSIALRDFLRRVLGAAQMAMVDLALRSLRVAATRRCALVLRGADDLIPIARALHARVLEPGRPFIVCDPRRGRHRATVRSPSNFELGMPALAAAAGGWLCVRAPRFPRDFDEVLLALRDARVLLVVCAQFPANVGPTSDVAPITVPTVATHEDELDEIIERFIDDAVRDLAQWSFEAPDRAWVADWVRTHATRSVGELEKATRRLVAIRGSRNISTAAARLGMAPVSLTRWFGRKGRRSDDGEDGSPTISAPPAAADR